MFAFASFGQTCRLRFGSARLASHSLAHSLLMVSSWERRKNRRKRRTSIWKRRKTGQKGFASTLEPGFIGFQKDGSKPSVLQRGTRRSNAILTRTEADGSFISQILRNFSETCLLWAMGCKPFWNAVKSCKTPSSGAVPFWKNGKAPVCSRLFTWFVSPMELRRL